MRQACGQLTHGQQTLLTRQKDLHEVRFSDVRQQDHLAPAGKFAARDVDEAAIAQFSVLGRGAAARDRPVKHHRK